MDNLPPNPLDLHEPEATPKGRATATLLCAFVTALFTVPFALSGVSDWLRIPVAFLALASLAVIIAEVIELAVFANRRARFERDIVRARVSY